MTYAAHYKDFAPYIDVATGQKSVVTKKPGVLRRIIDAIYRWPQRQVDREIAGFIEQSGGRFTDDLERRIERRLSPGSWNASDWGRDSPE
jgi:hypothetical protein